MRTFPATLIPAILAGLAFAPPISARNEQAVSRAQTAANGWTEHNDPSGFSVNTPAGWNVMHDAQQGRVTIRGQRGEQVVIWPTFVEQRQLDAAGGSALVQQLARKIDSQVTWIAAPASTTSITQVARAFAKSGQRSGAAVMTWTPTSNGTQIYFYCLEAPAALYSSSTDTFAAILKSFHIVQDPALKNAAAQGKPEASGAAGAPVSYVRWSDPHEGAFNMVVPQGWRVVGGAYRLTATDIRNGVTMMSPDGQIRIFVGDASLGIYTEPTQMLAMGGLHEGGHQLLGDGTSLEIRRYMTGQQFVNSYANGPLRKACANIQIQSNNARPDLASLFAHLAREEGMPEAQLAAGDVSFTCDSNGNAAVGKFVAGTIVPSPGRSSLWFVYRIYGYIAPAERKADAEKICLQAVQSWQIDPQWQARETQTANAAVQQDNLRAQQFRAQAMQAIQKDEQATTQMITQGYQQRQQVYNEIERRRENAILGEVDVIDPETGRQYKIDNYSDYHWMNNSGDIAGTRSGDDSPGTDWHQIITLP